MANITTTDVKNVVDFIKIHTTVNGDIPITSNTLDNYENEYVFENFKQMYGGECANKIDDIRILYVDYVGGGKKMGKRLGSAKKSIRKKSKKLSKGSKSAMKGIKKGSKKISSEAIENASDHINEGARKIVKGSKKHGRQMCETQLGCSCP